MKASLRRNFMLKTVSVALLSAIHSHAIASPRCEGAHRQILEGITISEQAASSVLENRFRNEDIERYQGLKHPLIDLAISSLSTQVNTSHYYYLPKALRLLEGRQDLASLELLRSALNSIASTPRPYRTDHILLAIIKGLEGRKEPQAISMLVEIFNRTESPTNSSESWVAIGKLDDALSFQALRQKILNSDALSGDRILIESVLPMRKDSAANDLWIELLTSRKASQHELAFFTFSMVSSHDRVQHVVTGLLKKESVHQRLLAVTLIGNYIQRWAGMSPNNTRFAIQLLERAFENLNPEVRLESIKEAGRMDNVAILPLIQRGAQDRDLNVRTSAIELIAEFNQRTDD